MNTKIETEVVVLGSGPGGYSAAFRAADLGKKVVMIERFANIGGVCLNVGCIPSKAYLHAARAIEDAAAMADKGIVFAKPEIDPVKLCEAKDKIVNRLARGLSGLAKRRNVTVIQGFGKFISSNEIEVETQEGKQVVHFENVIIAAGSRPRKLPFFPEDDPRIMDSTDALKLEDVNCHLLMIGSGIIGIEMATIYLALGAKLTIASSPDHLLRHCDEDIIMPLQRRLQRKCENVYYGTRVGSGKAKEDGIYVTFTGKNAPEGTHRFDRVLCATGLIPNSDWIGIEAIKVGLDEGNFIKVDEQMRTNVPHIFAIGDIVGEPLLAHDAIMEGRVAAEVIGGLDSVNDAKCIPSVAYTDPEVTWVGMTEVELQAAGIEYGKGEFPWAASGRLASIGRTEGKTKLLFDKKTEKLLGAAIVGVNADELIASMGLAIQNELTAKDIANTVFPHPSLSETIMMAAEAYEGTVTDL
jgi:dihydrolipoamide dehydrogenase